MEILHRIRGVEIFPKAGCVDESKVQSNSVSKLMRFRLSKAFGGAGSAVGESSDKTMRVYSPIPDRV